MDARVAWPVHRNRICKCHYRRSLLVDPLVNCFGFDWQYGYEYLGPSECITHTPSTDRHIVSILLALKQHQAGCLYGASSSGKTRTVAEIGKVKREILLFFAALFRLN